MDREPTTQSSHQARARIRAGEWTGPTAGLAPGHVQANLVVLPGDQAHDFERFCRANPRALPLLDVTVAGSATPARIAPESDVRLDLPRYRVYRHGELAEDVADIMTLWHADFVAFLIGCSFTFDALLQAHGLPVRHVELGCNVPMYVTNRATVPAGVFSGPLVVSMRPIRRGDVDRVVELTRGVRIIPRESPSGDSLPVAEPDGLRYACHGEPIHVGSPKALGIEDQSFPFHGEPIHVGSPKALGISDLQRPDYGDAVPVRDGEVPAFWACGVTAQAAAERSRVPLMITHAPGHMFITDLRVDEITGQTSGRTVSANRR